MSKPFYTPDQVNDVLVSTYSWGTSGAITYRFPTTNNWAGTEEFATYSAFSADQIRVAVEVMKLWDDLIAPDIVRVADNGASNIKFANSHTGVSYAHAYYPGSSLVSGSIWMNVKDYGAGSGGNNLATPERGLWGYSTYIHEVGHALGLHHAGDYSDASRTYNTHALYAQDNKVYSVMSYYTAKSAGFNWRNSSGVEMSSQTMMVYDIYAIQQMYGADPNTRTENTTYGFNASSSVRGGVFDFSANKNPILAIYDAGGNDTLDVSGFKQASRIDLRDGHYSDANGMTHNIGIAFGTVIENAKTGSGADNITGNAVRNVIHSGAGADTVRGGAGNDTIYLGGAADLGFGEDGDDTLYGEGGADQLYGGAGADILYGDGGSDKLWGDGGNDILHGGSGDDSLYGGTGSDTIYGGAGNDVIDAGSGSDRVKAGDGNDWIDGGTGEDSLYGENGNDVLSGGSGDDLIYGGSDNDTLYGGAGNDRLFGDGGSDRIKGGDGDDYIQGGSGSDQLYGEVGNDQISGGSGDDLLYGGAGNDTLYGGSGVDRLYGDAGHDRLKAGSGNDYLYGGSGNDSLYGENGNDVIYGGDGDDVLYGGAGSDTLYGGAGADIFHLTLGARADIADFQDGSDKISVAAIAKAIGYSGTNLISAGYLKIGYTTDATLGRIATLTLDRDAGGNAFSDEILGRVYTSDNTSFSITNTDLLY